VGATFYSQDMVAPKGEDPLTLDVRAVTPRLVRNTVDASIKVLVRHRNEATSHLGSDDLSFCSRTKPFVPGPPTVGSDAPGTNSIILAITTHRPGIVTIDGVHVTYRHGLRRGSQDTRDAIKIEAVRPAPPAPPVTRPPTVTTVEPAAGPTAGGSRVVILGSNFTDRATVGSGPSRSPASRSAPCRGVDSSCWHPHTPRGHGRRPRRHSAGRVPDRGGRPLPTGEKGRNSHSIRPTSRTQIQLTCGLR
jgi:IPT/TIG domain